MSTKLIQDYVDYLVKLGGDVLDNDKQALGMLLDDICDEDTEVYARLFHPLMLVALFAMNSPADAMLVAFQQGAAWERYKQQHQKEVVGLDDIKGL